MHRPDTPEILYLDFDGYFASVEQQARPRLRGRPVGVVPFEGTDRTCVIAVSKEAKASGVRSVMTVSEARQLCPDIELVPQSPDLYRRAHNTLLAEIESVIPIDSVKSIDELTCRLDAAGRRDPLSLVRRLKATLAKNVGPYITCSVGVAANRQLAKIAGEVDKPNGMTIWRPQDLPEPLFRIPLGDIPGVGPNMLKRLQRGGIFSTENLYHTAPKHLRALWGNVTGERLWYALHGYNVHAPESKRGMFGHGRVLPPESRSLEGAFVICRLLLIKAARRLRRAAYCCSGLWLWLAVRGGEWSGKRSLPIVHDDQAVLAGLDALWRMRFIPRSYFWICWKVTPRVSPNVRWLRPSDWRRSRRRSPTMASTGSGPFPLPRWRRRDWRGWIGEEVGGGDIENLGQLLQHIDRWRVNLTFQVADIGPVQAGLRGQFLLRHALHVAHPSQVLRHHRPQPHS